MLNSADDFRDLAAKVGFTPLPVIKTKHGDILIGERFYNMPTHDCDVPHWKVVWFLRRGGEEPLQTLYIEPWQRTPSGFNYYVSPEERKRLALEAAEQWIKDNEEIGRFT